MLYKILIKMFLNIIDYLMKLPLTLRNACALFHSYILLKLYKLIDNYFIKPNIKFNIAIYKIIRNVYWYDYFIEKECFKIHRRIPN